MSTNERQSRRRARFDDEDFPVDSLPTVRQRRLPADDEPDELSNLSTYRDAAHGPAPTPPWVITDANARDEDLGVLKSGKEADCSLVRRTLSMTGESCLLVAKRYRSANHRLFHRDAGYLEGRRVRRSRENRAMVTRTDFGKDLISDQWAVAEFNYLGTLWSAGVRVPYPVQQIGTEVMMEFIGSSDGVAAARVANVTASVDELTDLYRQCRNELGTLAELGYTHGDLSAYNVLVDQASVVLIDVPQLVDIVGNPQGKQFLERDCVNLCSWFSGRGVYEADAGDLVDELWSHVPSGLLRRR